MKSCGPIPDTEKADLLSARRNFDESTCITERESQKYNKMYTIVDPPPLAPWADIPKSLTTGTFKASTSVSVIRTGN